MKKKENFSRLVIFAIAAILLTTSLVATTAKYDDDQGANISGGPDAPGQGSAECPDNSLFCQLPYLPDESWIGYSAVDIYYIPYDNFWGLTSAIEDIHWWGVTPYDDPWALVFNIEFWTDSGGMPGTLVASYTGVTPTYTDTGLVYGATGYKLYEFSYDLDPVVDLSDGWVAIYIDYYASGYDWFYWWGSDDGDLNSWQWDYLSGMVPSPDDLAFALTGEAWNVKMHYPQWPDEDGWDVRASYPANVADDWMCTETGYVTDIHWWGSWIHDDWYPDELHGFYISIHADIPADESPTGYSMPGELLWERYVPIEDIVVTPIEVEGCSGGGSGPYTWEICLEDTWGDGWSGGTIDVYVNDGLVYDDLTILSGAGPECYDLTVYPGDLIDVYYTPGSYPSENIYYINDQFGTQVVYMQPYYDGDLEDFEVPYYEQVAEGWYDPFCGEVVYPDHCTYYQYDLENIDDPFLQWEGNVYWLDITADTEYYGDCPDYALWGWKTSEDHWNDDAVWRILGDRGEPVTFYLEDFETTCPPPGWVISESPANGDTWSCNTEPDWTSSCDPGGASGNFMEFDDDDYGSGSDNPLEELITAPIDCSGYSDIYLDFDGDFEDMAGAGQFWVYVSNDGGSSWTEVFYETDDVDPDGWNKHPGLPVYIGDVADGESDVRIKFVYSDTYDSSGDSGYAWGCLIDNVNLTGVEAVPPWAELIDPYTSESLDMAFVITGEPKGTVHNLDTDEWFTTIQKAIDDPDTADGHTIEVYLPMPEVFPSGKYEENVNVYKELTLVANATEATTFPYVVIDGGQAGPCITINANNVNIIGFELINGTDGVSSPGTTGSVIQNCNIHDNLNTGLYLESTMGLVIQDCRIYDNLDAGIHLESSDGNLISGCEIYNNDHVGIHLLSANDNVIEGCEFYGHHWDFGGGAFGAGVDVESSVGNDIHDNIFYDNDEGVRLWYNNDINYVNFNIFGRWCEEPGIAIHNYDDVIPDARYNWYAQDNGPSGDIPDAITGRMANGYGSAVIGNLNFDPWRGIDAFIDVSSTAALVGDPITFESSNSFHYDITGTPVDDILYEWNLGNGEYKFSEMFGYPYSEPGIYKVKLSARAPDSILDEDNGVLYDTATVYITISAAGAPLEADASPDMIEGYSGNGYTGAVDEPVQFYGIATGGLPPYTYHWEFGDGTTSDEQNPLHIYRTPGQYNVALTVTDSEGNTDSDVTFAVVKAADEPVTGVEICCVKGGFGVKATINNTEATSIDWEINVTGGFILFGGHANGTIPAETTETVSSGFMLGFGKVDIHICAGTVCKDATGFLLGPFVLGVTET